MQPHPCPEEQNSWRARFSGGFHWFLRWNSMETNLRPDLFQHPNVVFLFRTGAFRRFAPVLVSSRCFCVLPQLERCVSVSLQGFASLAVLSFCLFKVSLLWCCWSACVCESLIGEFLSADFDAKQISTSHTCKFSRFLLSVAGGPEQK